MVDPGDLSQFQDLIMLEIGCATRNTMYYKDLGIHLLMVEMMADSRSFEWNRRDGTQLDWVGGGELIDVGTRGLEQGVVGPHLRGSHILRVGCWPGSSRDAAPTPQNQAQEG